VAAFVLAFGGTASALEGSGAEVYRKACGRFMPKMQKDSAIAADGMATNLRALLAAANIRPPYILVGHSLGGIYVQM
jgi:pimeloyl-ACP methyl ester carboxylesterase